MISHVDISTSHLSDGTPVTQVMPVETITQLTDPDGPSGEELRSMAEEATVVVTQAWLGQIGHNGPKTVLSIPRGGLPIGRGVSCAIQSSGDESITVITNAGEGSDKNKGKLPNRLPKGAQTVVIADGVVGAGGETIAHIDALFRHLPIDQVQVIGLMNIAAATYGIQNVVNHVEKNYPGVSLEIATMRLYREGEYVGWVNINGKMVFVVGVGDFGKRVQGDSTLDQLYSHYRQ